MWNKWTLNLEPWTIQPAIVWIITRAVWACRHSGIWYFVPVLNTNRSTHWTTGKKKEQSNNKTIPRQLGQSCYYMFHLTQKCRDIWWANIIHTPTQQKIPILDILMKRKKKIKRRPLSLRVVFRFITCRAKLLNADWLRQRAFFLNRQGPFGNQEGMKLKDS